jgi:hypothetical protein
LPQLNFSSRIQFVCGGCCGEGLQCIEEEDALINELVTEATRGGCISRLLFDAVHQRHPALLLALLKAGADPTAALLKSLI